MAKRLNKQMVLGLTVFGMLVTTAVGIWLLTRLPQKDIGPLVESAEEFVAKGKYAEAMQQYVRAGRRARAIDKKESAIKYEILAGEMALKAGSAGDARNIWRGVMLLDPKNEEAQQHLVELLLEFAELGAGWGDVRQEAQTLLEINPENPLALYALGRAQVQLRHVDPSYAEEGRENLTNALAMDPSNPEYAQALAEYYVIQDQYDAAENVYGTLIAEHLPEDQAERANAYLYRGHFFLQKKSNIQNELNDAVGAEAERLSDALAATDQQALEDLSKAAELAPEGVDALLALGRYWQFKRSTAEATDEVQQEQEGYREKAVGIYKQAIASNPESFEPYQRLAQLYAAEGRLEDALQVLRARLERQFEREHYLAQLNAMRMIALREDAFKYNVALLQENARKLAMREITQTQFDELEDMVMQRLRTLHSETIGDSPAGEDDAWALFMEARLNRLENNPQAAISALETALKRATIGTLQAQIRHTLAELYLQAGAYGPARQQLNEILQNYRGNPNTWAMLAEVNLRSYDPASPDSASQLGQAMNAARTALQIDSNNRKALTILAAVYRLQGNEEAADRIQSDLEEGMDVRELNLRQASRLRLQADDDPALLKQAETILRDILQEDPSYLPALREIVLVLDAQSAGTSESEKSKLATEMKTLLASAAEAIKEERNAASEKGEDLEYYDRMLDTVNRLRVMADLSIDESAKIRRMAEVIKQNEEGLDQANQLFILYRRIPEFYDDALAQAKIIVSSDLKQEEAAILNSVFEFAMARKNWDFAQRCASRATDMGLDPSDGHLYQGRILLAKSTEDPALAEAAEDELRAAVEASPNLPMAHVWLGQAYMATGQRDQAAAAFERARNLNPRNPQALIGLALLAELAQDQARLARLLASLEQVAPNHPWVQQKLLQRDEQQDPEQGIARREQIRQQQPENVGNLQVLASLYAQAGQEDKAEEAYQAAFEVDRTNLGLIQTYASFLRTKSQPEPDKAGKLLQQAIEAMPDDAAREKAYGQLLYASHLANLKGAPTGREAVEEEWSRVDEAYNKAGEISPTTNVFVEIANYYLQTRRPGESEEWLRKAVEAASKDNIDAQKEPLSQLISVMLSQRGRENPGEVQEQIDHYRDLYPNDPRTDLYQGILHSSNGNEPAAIESFTAYIEQAPQNPTGYFYRGSAYLRTSRWDQAISDLREVKRLQPNFRGYQPRVMLAGALENAGQLDAAIAELQSILDEQPNALPVAQELLNMYMRHGRADAADSLIAPRAEANPDNPRWSQLRAQIALQQGQADKAIRFARQAVEKSDKTPEMVDLLLQTFLRFNRNRDLIAFVTSSIPQEARSSQIMSQLGAAYAGTGNATEAIDAFAQALTMTPINFATFQSMFVASLNRSLPIDKARQAIEQRLLANPDDLATKLLKAFGIRAQEDYPGYAEALRTFLDEIPDNPTDAQAALQAFAMKELALTQNKLNNHEQARELYEQVLEQKPNDIIALNNLAYLLMTDLNNPEAALPYAKRAAEQAGSSAGILDTLGWNYVLLGELNDAIAYLLQAIENNSRIAEIHYHAAVAFARRAETDTSPDKAADLEQAKTELRRAYELLNEVGQDPADIMDKILQLGENLGMGLERPAWSESTSRSKAFGSIATAA